MSKFEKPVCYNPVTAEKRIAELEENVKKLEDMSLDVVFVCDRQKCGEKCCYPDCKHTTDITHAVNFKNEMGHWWEKVDG